MFWYNGSIHRKAASELARMAEEYRAAGMTEEQIREIAAFDLEVLRSDRRFYRHSQQLGPDGAPEDAPEPAEDGSEPPLPSRLGWLEEVEDPDLIECLKEAPPELAEILTLWVFEGWRHHEIARMLGCSRQTVTAKLLRFRDELRKRRRENGEK